MLFCRIKKTQWRHHATHVYALFIMADAAEEQLSNLIKTVGKCLVCEGSRLARQSTLVHHSKYLKVCATLPHNNDDNIGYHSYCYKNFTAFSKNKELSVLHCILAYNPTKLQRLVF